MSHRSTSARRLACAAFVILLLSIPLPLLAAPEPSPDVLLPWFAIDLRGGEARTTGSVINASALHARVEITVYTNWGIPVLSTEALLDETEPETFDLTRWIVDGELPERTLVAGELAHLHAALSGTKSPRDGLYYATAVAPSLATGYVVIRALDPPDGSLAGDALVRDAATGHVRGGPLTALGPGLQAGCERHAIRIPDASWSSGAPRLTVWTGRRLEPSTTPAPSGTLAGMTVRLFDTAGNPLTECTYSLIAAQLVELSCGNADASIGWIEVVTDVPAEIAGMTQPADGESIVLSAFCLQEALDLVGPELAVTVHINGGGSEGPPGTLVPAGDPIEVTYELRNQGDSPIDGIAVSDRWMRDVQCPAGTLAPDATMLCSASSIALPCRHEHVGLVTARGGDGSALSASDSAWYTGTQTARIAVESRINGDDADAAPGPTVNEGSALVLTWEITNAGDAPLEALEVDDGSGFAATCPKHELAAGETIVCTAAGIAARGPHELLTRVTATSPCRRIEASDPANYFGRASEPAIQIVNEVDGVDANTPPGPSIPNGKAIEFRFVVTNVGNDPLTGITVTDDEPGPVTCPSTTLDVAASMTCTAASVALACAHANVATATGTSPLGAVVTDDDAAYYFGTPAPAISLETAVNGDPADVAPGPVVAVDAPLQFTYIVTNTGDVSLALVGVNDDSGNDVVCPKSALQPGESMTCTAAGVALSGSHARTGEVTGTPPCGDVVTASDSAFYLGLTSGVAVETLVNGEEADTPPGPAIVAGTSVMWTFVVTNIGTGTLTALSVTADTGLTVTCPKTALSPGESMTCVATGVALTGQYSLIGTAAGTPEAGPIVTSSDPAHCFGVNPAVAIESLTNGEDADTPPGPALLVGATVSWSYVVTNTGDVTLTNVAVSDDKGVAVTCPKMTLAAAESMTCTASGTAVPGQYSNIGTVAAVWTSVTVSASDPSHCYGVVSYQGCTPGYWVNHNDSWPPTGYAPSQTVLSVFAQSASYPAQASSTLSGALRFAGGSGTNGAAEILLRAGTGALLNAAHPSVTYPRTPADVLTNVNAALASWNRDTMLALAAQLDAANNLGCPLN